ncbi:MAG: hypothetical protein OZ921_03255 [Sorangiineae bacterium]|nr:hypothetical protein [Polyangiaceae bacterium]MEB2321506.1 hypothetical protein [Sorangiineae bacterium]
MTTHHNYAAYAAAFCLLFGAAACGNGHSAGSESPSSHGGHDGTGHADDLIGQILDGVPTSSGGAQPSAPPDDPNKHSEAIQPSRPSDSGGGSGSGSGGGTRLDTFDEDVTRIKGTVPGWDNGTGIAIRFLKESTGTRLSLIFVDPTPPVLKDGVGLWMIQGKANASGKTIANYVLLLKTLAPGRYEGSPTKKDVVMSVAMSDTWDGKAPDTTWSINDGSWCEIVLRQGRGPNDLEGDFRAKLVDNSGNSFHSIENGYVYIKR